MKRPEDFAGIFIHRDRVDMRKSINGLSGVVQEAQMGDLRGSYLFVFCGRRKNTIKVLYWDKSGFALWQKRLEEARFPEYFHGIASRIGKAELSIIIKFI